MSSKLTFEEATQQAIDWLKDEIDYTRGKFGIKQDLEHVIEFSDVDYNNYDEQWWTKQLENYFHRAFIVGLEYPAGRQALAKFVSTGLGMLIAAIMVEGDLPEAGVPSGEIRMIGEGER